VAAVPGGRPGRTPHLDGEIVQVVRKNEWIRLPDVWPATGLTATLVAHVLHDCPDRGCSHPRSDTSAPVAATLHESIDFFDKNLLVPHCTRWRHRCERNSGCLL
jgi:hypothetical protein